MERVASVSISMELTVILAVYISPETKSKSSIHPLMRLQSLSLSQGQS